MIMPFEGTHTVAEQDGDVSPFLAVIDEEAYLDAILPLLGDIPTPPVTEPMPWDEEDEEQEVDGEPSLDFDPDGWKVAQDSWERAFWGD